MIQDKEQRTNSLRKEIDSIIDHHTNATENSCYEEGKHTSFLSNIVGKAVVFPYKDAFLILLPNKTFIKPEWDYSYTFFVIYELTESGLEKLKDIKEKYKDILNE